ncbi:unnamed protein product [Caenorhabditis brenneri]
MPKASGNRAKKPKKQPKEDLSKVMEQLSVTTDKSRKNPPSVSDMPVDVVGLIIEKLDYRQQLKLRKVSKSFRAFVDEQKPALTSLKISFQSNCIICNYNDHCVAYRSPNWTCAPPDTIITDVQFAKIAFDDLTFTLKNPKLQLDTFSFLTAGYDHFEDDFGDDPDYDFRKNGYGIEEMQCLFKYKTHRLSVKACEIDISGLKIGISILPYLKTLEKITIFSEEPDEKCFKRAIQRIARLDQWKQAKELVVVCEYAWFSMEHVSHFKRFQFNERNIQLDVLISIGNCLSLLNNFEYCLISAENPSGAQQFRSEAGGPVAPSHYSIPDSEYYLEFMFFKKSVEIRKIKRS